MNELKNRSYPSPAPEPRHSEPDASFLCLAKGVVCSIVAAAMGSVSPVMATDSPPAPALRVLAEGVAASALRIDTQELTWKPQVKRTRLSLVNITEAPLDLTVRTSLLCGDENRFGGVQGLTRGFVGVLFLGASEIPSTSGPVESSHTLQPGERLVVEHTLDAPAQVQEVLSTINSGLLTSTAKNGMAERESQVRQHRQTRDHYHQARRQEEERWKEVRSRLIAAQAQCQPLTPEYKACLERYWQALSGHKDRLKSLEAEFPPSAPSED